MTQKKAPDSKIAVLFAYAVSGVIVTVSWRAIWRTAEHIHVTHLADVLGYSDFVTAPVFALCAGVVFFGSALVIAHGIPAAVRILAVIAIVLGPRK